MFWLGQNNIEIEGKIIFAQQFHFPLPSNPNYPTNMSADKPELFFDIQDFYYLT